MNKIYPAAVALGETNNGIIRRFAADHRTTILRVAVISMALFADSLARPEFRETAFGAASVGGVDLRLRYNEVQLWFAGASVYSEQSNPSPSTQYTRLRATRCSGR